MNEQPKAANRAMIWLLIHVAALPSLIPLWLIHRDGVNVPYMDQWGHYAESYVKSNRGLLTLWDFTEQQNEHRMFVPKVIYYLLNSITHWNTIGEMLATWVIVFATSLNIAWLCFRTTTPLRAAILWGICNLLIFTPVQWENWTWGLGVINVLPMWFITAAMVVVLTRWPIRIRLTLAIGLATGATFSSGQGILSWPLLLPLLVWSKSFKELLGKKWIAAAWIAAFVLNLVLYNIGYQEPDRPPQLQGYYVSPILVCRFVLAFLGSPVMHYPQWPPSIGESMFAGAVALALFGGASVYCCHAWVKRREYEFCGQMAVWLMIGLYSVLSALIASEFRARQGEWMSMSSRYATCSLFLPVALVILLPMVAMDLGRQSVMLKRSMLVPQLALLAGLCIVYFISFRRAIANADIDAAARHEGKVALMFARFLPDNRWLAELVGPNAKSRIPIAEELNSMGYLSPPLYSTNNLLDLQYPIAHANLGELEPLQDGNNHPGYLLGWAMLPDHRPADGVVLSYEDENHKQIVFLMGKMAILPRQDLVAKYGDTAYLYSGWVAPWDDALIPLDILQARITAWAIDSETARAYHLDGGLTYKRH